MSESKSIRIGIMGFGRIGRQLVTLASRAPDLEVVAIADVAPPEVLLYLLRSEDPQGGYELSDNFLTSGSMRARMMSMDLPKEVPWDAYQVDVVIDATGKYGEASYMQDHLSNGAPRVVLRTLPTDSIDRIVLPGINEQQIQSGDRMISAGSGTTTAIALLLHALSAKFAIECASFTTVHAYTSDQALQDYAGSDFRRSRSAASNIIPNGHDATRWLGQILPEFDGKVLTSALNVPIREGSLLDANLVLADESVTPEAINEAMVEAAQSMPELLQVTHDPIVSSDVRGKSTSLLFDAVATLKAGKSIVKVLGWYESLGHAARLIDVVRLYAALDKKEAS